jgi:hypothetical protein
MSPGAVGGMLNSRYNTLVRLSDQPINFSNETNQAGLFGGEAITRAPLSGGRYRCSYCEATKLLAGL